MRRINFPDIQVPPLIVDIHVTRVMLGPRRIQGSDTPGSKTPNEWGADEESHMAVFGIRADRLRLRKRFDR